MPMKMHPTKFFEVDFLSISTKKKLPMKIHLTKFFEVDGGVNVNISSREKSH